MIDLKTALETFKEDPAKMQDDRYKEAIDTVRDNVSNGFLLDTVRCYVSCISMIDELKSIEPDDHDRTDEATAYGRYMDIVKKYLGDVMDGSDDIRIEVSRESEDDISAKDIPKWIRSMPGLDISEGLKMCGDAEVYMDALGRFARYAEDDIASMREFLKNGDIKNFTIKVHSLKTSARMIGAIELADKALNLEREGDAYEVDSIRLEINDLFTDYTALANSLMPINQKDAMHPGKKEKIGLEDVQSIFRHMKLYVEEFNDEALGSMLNALSRYDFPGQAQKKFESFVRRYEAGDWQGMIDILSLE